MFFRLVFLLFYLKTFGSFGFCTLYGMDSCSKRSRYTILQCTSSCGVGDQTRLVLCGFNGTIRSDALCIGEVKPKEKRRCNLHKCRTKRLSKEWTSESWSQVKKPIFIVLSFVQLLIMAKTPIIKPLNVLL